MALIIYWFVIPVSILFITGPVAATVFIALLQRGHRRGLGLFWLRLGLTTLLLGLFTIYTFGNLPALSHS
jgi:hypothetical protein